jgi:hypothetical protein
VLSASLPLKTQGMTIMKYFGLASFVAISALAPAHSTVTAISGEIDLYNQFGESGPGIVNHYSFDGADNPSIVFEKASDLSQDDGNIESNTSVTITLHSPASGNIFGVAGGFVSNLLDHDGHVDRYSTESATASYTFSVDRKSFLDLYGYQANLGPSWDFVSPIQEYPSQYQPSVSGTNVLSVHNKDIYTAQYILGPGIYTISLDGSAFNKTVNDVTYDASGNYTLSGLDTAKDWTGAANFTIGAIPEPSSWGMLFCGIGFVGGAMRRGKSLSYGVRVPG